MATETLSRYASKMKILARDHEVLVGISRWSMMSSLQIHRVFFRTSKSETSMRNTMGRLERQGLVVRIGEPAQGGAKGGRGQIVYRLSRDGWRYLRDGRYKVRTSIDKHALDVVNVHIATLDTQDELVDGKQWLRIHYTEVEEEAYRKIEGYAIRPDIYYELDNLTRMTRRHLFIEVDRGSETRTQIFDKVNRYTHAKMHDRGTYKVFPDVLFLAHDQQRLEQLKRWVGSSQTIQGDRVFYFGLMDEFPRMLQ